MRTNRKSTGLITLVSLLPLLYLLFRVAGARWFPAGDDAMLMLRINDAGTHATPLLGPYSRYGWNHPGPLMFYLLAVPYRLTAGATWGVLAGCVIINILSIAGMVHLVWTYLKVSAAALTAGACALTALSLSPYVLESPWNPHITTFPFALFIVAAWATRIDNRWLPLTFGLGTFLVQSHAGFAPAVTVLCAWSLLALRHQRPSRKTTATTVAILTVCWLPVLLDQLFGEQNINQLITFFTTTELPTVGMKVALGVAARELTGFAPWMSGAIPFIIDSSPLWIARLTFPLLAYGIALWLTKKYEQRNAFQLLVGVGLAAVMSVFAVSRITDGLGYYLIQFWTPLAMLFWVAVVSGIISCLDKERVEKAAVQVTAVGTAVIACFGIASFRHSQVPTPLVQQAIASTFPAVTEKIERIENVEDGKKVYIEARGINGGWFKDALCLQLEREGVRCLVDGTNVDKVGEARIGNSSDATAHIVIATGEEVLPASLDPANKKLAEYSGPSHARMAEDPSLRIVQGPPNEQLVIYQHS